MELVEEVRAAVHATANAEYAAWVEHAGGLDLAPLSVPGLPLEAWVVSPRAARPPVGVLLVRVGSSLVLTSGDAAAAGKVLAGTQVAEGDLPIVLFELLRSRARPMAMVASDLTGAPSGAWAPTVSRVEGAMVVRLCVTRGALAPEAWTLVWSTPAPGSAGTLRWTRAPLADDGGTTP